MTKLKMHLDYDELYPYFFLEDKKHTWGKQVNVSEDFLAYYTRVMTEFNTLQTILKRMDGNINR